MDWDFVIHHLLSGFIPVIPFLFLYYIFLYSMGKKQTSAHMIATFVFIFYIIGILALTGICLPLHFSPSIVLIPFLDMISGPVDTALNVLLFVPLGFLLPVLYKKFDSAGRTVLTGFLMSLSVEILQMFESGNTDINDLITNTAGTLLGYGIFRLIRRFIPETLRRTLLAKGVNDYSEMALFWICSIICMLTVQIFIFHRVFR